MNKDRRKQIDAAMAAIEKVKDQFEAALAELADAKEAIDGVKDEEQEAYDNLPESLQDGEKGQQMQYAVEKLEEAVNELEELVDNAPDFDAIIGALDEAKAA